MGKCTFCGDNVGFLKSKHKECEDKYNTGIQRIKNEIINIFNETGFLAKLERYIFEATNSSFASQHECRQLLIDGWINTVDNYLSDGLLDQSEERRLVEFKNKFNLTQSELDKSGAMTKTTQAAVLRDLMNGIIPNRINIDGSQSINFQKNERIIWLFNGCDLLEDKTKRQYVGASHGVSIRVAKGLYYRTSAFKGNPIEFTERVKMDRGIVAVTDKNIYFSGNSKSIRIPYNKIVSFIPFSDGFGVLRDTANAKPQIFVTGDGWFSYNLAVNAAQI